MPLDDSNKPKPRNRVRIFGAGGGGKGAGGPPVEAGNTLQTNAILRLIEVLGEGPIKGVRQVYLNETPLTENNKPNFKGVSVTHRLGLPSQAPVKGFSSQEADVIHDALVIKSTPIIQTITDPATDAIRVTVKIPALFEYKDNGDMVGAGVSYRVQYRPNGGGWIDIPGSPFELENEKNTAPVFLPHRFDLTGAAPWDVRVVRVSDDTTDNTKLQNAIFYYSTTQIIDQKLSYPYTAYMAMEINAQQFGDQVPSRAALVDGLICRVPVNFDPETRTYTGMWNGTFKNAWTDCPAWCLYEMITNPRFGLGEFVQSSAIDPTTLYTISQYCAQPVSNGAGGTEPRFTFNAYIGTRQEAYDLINAMVSVFRGMVYWSLGAAMFTHDAPGTPILNVTRANTVNGEFSYQGSSILTVHNRVNVTYNNPDNLYKRDVVSVDDPEHIAKYGLRPTDIIAFGCTSRAQAIRAGRWLMYTERMESDILTYVAGPDHVDAVPGSIIRVMDPSVMGVDTSGRLVAYTSNTVTLDREVTLLNGVTYELVVHDADRVLHYRTVTSAPGARTVITLGANLPVLTKNPMETVYVLRRSTGQDTLYRILSLREVGDHQYEVTAIRHNPDKYSIIENGYRIPSYPVALLPTGPLPVPRNLQAREQVIPVSGTMDRSSVFISVTRPSDPRIRGLELQYRRLGQEWQVVDLRSNPKYTIDSAAPGDRYQFQCRSYDALGNTSEFTDIVNLRISGNPTEKTIPGITNPTIIAGVRQIQVRWNNPENLDSFKEVEVFANTVNNSATATRIASTPAERVTLSGLNPGDTRHVWLRVVQHGAPVKRGGLVYAGSATVAALGNSDVAPGALELDRLGTSVIAAIDAAAGSAAGDVLAAQAAANTAQVAATNASTAANNAQTAMTNAQAAFTAADNARIAALSAQTAAQAAQATATQANTDAQSALSQTITARNAAQTAQTNATNASTAAQTAQTAAETARNAAQTAQAAAAASSTSASTASGVAVRTAADLLPSDFVNDGTYWTHNLSGAPTSRGTLLAAFTFPTLTPEGKVASITAPVTMNTHMATRGYIAAIAGRRYRMTIRARHVGAFAGNSQFAINVNIRRVTSAFAGGTDIVATQVVFTSPDTWQDFVVEGTHSGTDPYLLPFIYFAPSTFGATGPVIQIQRILVQDVTSEVASSNSASAAATSASAAGVSATNAQTSANAAQTARTAAETARSGAETAQTNAATSATNAASSAASASTSATVASNASTRGVVLASGNLFGRERFEDNLRDPFDQGTVVTVTGHPNGATRALNATTRDTWTPFTSGSLAGRVLRFQGVVDASLSPYQVQIGVHQTDVAATNNQFQLTPVATANEAVKTFDVTITVPTVAWSVSRWRLLLQSNGAAGNTDHNVRWSQVTCTDITERTAAQGSASAAATSAASAATSASNAGLSATSAQNSAVSARLTQTNAALLPFDFRDGLSQWTSDRTGDPATRVDPAGYTIVNDAELGSAAEVTWTTAGQNLLPRGVLRLQAGRIYRLTTRFKVLSSAGNVAVPINSVFQLLSSTFADAGATFGPDVSCAPSATTVYQIIRTFSSAAATGVDAVIAGIATSPFARIGPRISGTGLSAVTRIGLIRIEDVTESVVSGNNATAAAGSASAAATSASSASTSASNAGSFASQASTSASTAATSASNAASSATAAATSASNASTSATNAANSATSATTSANSASTSAGNAATSASQAATSASNALGSANSAATSATTAADTLTAAQRVAADLLPSDFTRDGLFWTNNLSGAPGAPRGNLDSNITFTTLTPEGRVAVMTAPLPYNVHIATKGYVPAVVGRRYRLVVRVRHVGAFAGNSQTAFRLAMWRISDSGVNDATLANLTYTFAAPDTWYDATLEVVYSGTQPYFMPFVWVASANFGTAGPVIQVQRLRVEDVTSLVEAQNAASAAATSASTAAASQTAAASSASAAQTAQTAAETARSNAQASQTAAATSATNAANSASNAATSATNAANSATLAGSSATAANTSATNAATSASDAAISASTSQAALVSARLALTNGPVLPFDFRDGLVHWTDTDAGSPSSLSNPAGHTIVSDAQLGQAVEFTWNTVGQILMTRGVMSVAAGRIYRVTCAFKVMSTTGNASMGVMGFVRTMNEAYTGGVGAGGGNLSVAPSTTTVYLFNRTFSSTALTGVDQVIAELGTLPFARFGFRSNAASLNAVMRVGVLRVEDITDRVLANNSATAASGSASSAATSATNAGTSATAAASSATAAATSAGNASTSASNAATSATSASGSANSAATSATTAATALSNAQRAIADIFPSDFQNDGTYWTSSLSGAPGAGRGALSASVTFTTLTPEGRVAAITAPVVGNVIIAARGYITAIAGRRYRVTARIRHVGAFAGNSQTAVNLNMRRVSAAFASGTDFTASGYTFAAPDTWYDYVIEGTYSGTDPYLCAFVWVNGTNFATGGPVVQVASLRVQDVTSEFAAAGSATAAANSATAAAASQTAAGNSASSAATSATNAATSAGNAAGSATAAATSATQASTSASNAAGSASSASTSATTASNSANAAVSAVAQGFPPDFALDGQFFQSASTGAPTAGGTLTGNFAFSNDGTSGRTFQFTPLASGVAASCHHRGVVAGVVGRQYRVTVRARLDGTISATNSLTLQIVRLDSAYANPVVVATTNTAALGAAYANYTLEYTAVSADTFLRFGVLKQAATTGTGSYRIVAFIVEDITSETAAAGSASAAATSASNAATSATNAGNSATAASTSATNASTSAGNAAGSASSASTSALSASSSASSAAGSSAQALEYRNAAARMTSGGVSKNPVFNDWPGTNPDNVSVILGGSSSIAKVTSGVRYVNAINLVGSDAAQDRPILRINTVGNTLDCVPNPQRVIVRAEVELISGSLNGGAALTAAWVNDSGGTNAFVTELLSSFMVAQTGRIQSIEWYVERPAFFVAGTVPQFQVDIRPVSSFNGATPAVCTLRVHRLDFEVVTQNSMAEVFQRAKVSVDNIASSAVGLRAVAGSAGALLELVALDNPAGNPASAARIAADNIILDGSVTAAKLTVGPGNMVANPSFAGGSATDWRRAANGLLIDVVARGGTGVQANMPATHAMRMAHPSTQTQIAVWNGKASTDPGAELAATPVVGGAVYRFSVDAAANVANAMDYFIVRANWRRADGTVTFVNAINLTSIPSVGWQTYTGNLTAPADAVSLHVQILSQNLAGQAVNMWFTNTAVRPATTGDLVVNGTIDTQHLAAQSITAALLSTSQVITTSAQIGDGLITNAKIGNVIQSDGFVSGAGGTGWRIQKNGSAEFTDIILRRQIEVDSGTLNVGTFTPSSTGSGADSAFNGVWATEGRAVFLRNSSVLISAWQGATRTYIATAGMTGTVVAVSGMAPDVYWGWDAEVLPLTIWSGTQSLKVRFGFWSRNVTQVQNCVLSWKIYEVS